MKMRQWWIPIIATIIISGGPSRALSQTPEHKPAPSPLIAAGSGVNLGITRLLAEAFQKANPLITIEVPGSIGSKGAIAAVSDGAIALGLISRPLSEQEKSLPMVARPYAKVPIVVGVHPAVAENEITSQDLVDIYKGRKTRWQDKHEIIVQTREPFDSGIQVVEKKIPGFKEAYGESRQAKRWAVYFTDQEANRAIATTPYAIGFTDLGMIATERLAIKVLRLNGIVPGPESLLDGRYPLSRDLSFLYREEHLSEGAKAFLDFVSSTEGAAILISNGYIPAH